MDEQTKNAHLAKEHKGKEKELYESCLLCKNFIDGLKVGSVSPKERVTGSESVRVVITDG